MTGKPHREKCDMLAFYLAEAYIAIILQERKSGLSRGAIVSLTILRFYTRCLVGPQRA